jgi:hypothetical protein
MARAIPREIAEYLIELREGDLHGDEDVRDEKLSTRAWSRLRTL